MPQLEAGLHVLQRAAARVVEMQRQALGWDPLQKGANHSVDVIRGCDTNRVTDRHLLTSEVEQGIGDAP